MCLRNVLACMHLHAISIILEIIFLLLALHVCRVATRRLLARLPLPIVTPQ